MQDLYSSRKIKEVREAIEGKSFMEFKKHLFGARKSHPRWLLFGFRGTFVCLFDFEELCHFTSFFIGKFALEKQEKSARLMHIM